MKNRKQRRRKKKTGKKPEIMMKSHGSSNSDILKIPKL